MGVPLLTSCCCGCSLRTGTIIIGCLNMIPLIYLMGSVFIGVPMVYMSLPPDEQEKTIREVVVGCVVIMVFVAIGILHQGLLLIGAYKKNAKMLKGWVNSSMFIGFLGIILTTLLLLAGAYDPNKLWKHIPPILIECFFILVVYSFYKEIENSPHHLTHSTKSYDVLV